MIEPESFESPEVQAMAEAQQAASRALYGGEADIGPTREGWMFEPPDGVFLVAREAGRAVACGGICRFDASRAEVKRMYVVPEARGRGLGRAILQALEDAARELGYGGIVLETGELHHEALGLYTTSGYEPIPCYGAYAERAISRCFEKRL